MKAISCPNKFSEMFKHVLLVSAFSLIFNVFHIDCISNYLKYKGKFLGTLSCKHCGSTFMGNHIRKNHMISYSKQKCKHFKFTFNRIKRVQNQREKKIMIKVHVPWKHPEVQLMK